MSYEQLATIMNLDEFHAYCKEKGVKYNEDPEVAKKFPIETAFAYITDAFTVMRNAYPHNYTGDEVAGIAGRVKNHHMEITPKNIQKHLISPEGSARLIDLLFHFIGVTIDHVPDSDIGYELSQDDEEKVEEGNDAAERTIKKMSEDIGITPLGVTAILSTVSMQEAYDNNVNPFKLLRLLSDIKSMLDNMKIDDTSKH